MSVDIKNIAGMIGVVIKWLFWVWAAFIFMQMWQWYFIGPLVFATVCGLLIKYYIKRVPQPMIPAVSCIIGGIVFLIVSAGITKITVPLVIFDIVLSAIALGWFMIRPGIRPAYFLAGYVLWAFIIDVFTLISVDTLSKMNRAMLLQIILKFFVLGFIAGGVRRLRKAQEGGK